MVHYTHANRNGKVCYLHRHHASCSRPSSRGNTWRHKWWGGCGGEGGGASSGKNDDDYHQPSLAHVWKGCGRRWSWSHTREKRIPAGKPSRQRRVPRDLTVPVEFPIALQWEFILTDVPAAARAQLADGHPKVIMISNRFLYIYRYLHSSNVSRTSKNILITKLLSRYIYNIINNLLYII